MNKLLLLILVVSSIFVAQAGSFKKSSKTVKAYQEDTPAISNGYDAVSTTKQEECAEEEQQTTEVDVSVDVTPTPEEEECEKEEESTEVDVSVEVDVTPSTEEECEEEKKIEEECEEEEETTEVDVSVEVDVTPSTEEECEEEKKKEEECEEAEENTEVDVSVEVDVTPSTEEEEECEEEEETTTEVDVSVDVTPTPEEEECEKEEEQVNTEVDVSVDVTPTPVPEKEKPTKNNNRCKPLSASEYKSSAVKSAIKYGTKWCVNKASSNGNFASSSSWKIEEVKSVCKRVKGDKTYYTINTLSKVEDARKCYAFNCTVTVESCDGENSVGKWKYLVSSWKN